MYFHGPMSDKLPIETSLWPTELAIPAGLGAWEMFNPCQPTPGTRDLAIIGQNAGFALVEELAFPRQQRMEPMIAKGLAIIAKRPISQLILATRSCTT